MTDGTNDDLELCDRIAGCVRALRIAREMTQTELGVCMGGVPQTTVSRWEAGDIDFTVSQVSALERALGTAPGALLVAAGCVSPEALEPTEHFRRRHSTTDFDEILEMLRAAITLDLGVRLRNRAELDSGDPAQWVLDLLDEPAPA